ncbi:MAG: acetolactate synthase small subunit, partial [Pseudomonadota bacterium]
SLSVNETLDPTMSQMTIVTRGDDRIIEQINKQLNKLIDVIKVVDYESRGAEFIERELALIKVNVDEHKRSEVLSIIDIFRGKVVDVSRAHYTIEVTGDENKIDAIVNLLRPIGIRELVRSGKAAVSREHKGK